MKRYMVVFIALLILLTNGCSDASNKHAVNINNESSDESNNNTTETESYEGEEYLIVNAHLYYRTFEECISYATNVLTATFTGKVEICEDKHELIFSPVEQLKGSDIIQDFRVSMYPEIDIDVIDRGMGYHMSSSDYEQGKTYLLVLEKFASVYRSYDVYGTNYVTMIEEGKPAKMYGNSPISRHSDIVVENPDINDIVEYIKGNNIEDKSENHMDYIRSKDITDIIQGTPIIACVTPIEFIYYNGNNVELYTCEVNIVYKGNVLGEKIKIGFEKGTVELGENYIVFIKKLSDPSTFYILSSKNSVHSPNEVLLAQIEALVEKT